MVLVWASSLMVAVAAGFLSWAGLTGLVDVARILRRRSFAARLQQILRESRETQQIVRTRRPSPMPILAGLGAGLVLAVLWHHPVLSLWWIILGGAFGWAMVSTRTLPRQMLQVEEIFVSGLRNVYPVVQSVAGALEIASSHLPEAGEELRAMVAEVLRRLNSSVPLRESLSVFRESGWPMLGRLSIILEQAEHADEQSVLNALDTLVDRIRSARLLLDRASTVLVLNKLTLRALQIANLAGILMVSLVPTWHKFYADRPAGLIAATAMALAGTWYFSSEIRRIEAMLL